MKSITSGGRSSWLHSAANVDFGYSLSKNGVAFGYSRRYFPGSTVGSGNTAWAYDGVHTQIGIYDQEHTGGNGVVNTSIHKTNELGQAIGTSRRYNDSSGQSFSSSYYTGWLYDGSETTRVGLYDSLHTAADGRTDTKYLVLNNSSQAAGISSRFGGSEGNTWLGETAWFSDGGEHTVIGLVGGGFDDDSRNGFRQSSVAGINDRGHVIGTSNLYNRSSLGSVAWVFDGEDTRPIGLYENEHFERQRNDVVAINEIGNVIGHADRFSGGADSGQSAWFYTGGSTNKIGLVGSEHTSNRDYQENYVSALTESGFVLGYASRFENVEFRTAVGRSIWISDGISTREIGLQGDDYIRSDDVMESNAFDATDINEAGQVVGWSRRYLGGNNGPGVAWFYDYETDVTHEMLLSTGINGHGRSRFSYLGEDGVALGNYDFYDDSDGIQSRAFMFSLEGGAIDLGFLVNAGTLESDWKYLADALGGRNANGEIAGWGYLGEDLGYRGFTLSPITSVPEPSSLLVGLSALLFLTTRRKRSVATVARA